MKSFSNYLTENKKTYSFRIKMANLPEGPDMNKLESVLEKYSLQSMSKPIKTPIQEHPMDFQTLTNAEVYIMDADLDYMTTAYELHEYLVQQLGEPHKNIVVINKNDPEEIAREQAVEDVDKEYVPLMGSDLEEVIADPTYGDKYNQSFLKELESTKQEFAAASDASGETTNDLPQGDKSPVGSVTPTQWPWND
tara:strand:- start:7312 stop:7893 length:582 start_codon:yes stop_codon:yes gene_type:complete